MKKIFVYNNDSKGLETYYLNGNDYMPYNANNTLTVDEFAPDSNLLWTTTNAMKAYNNTMNLYPNLILTKAFSDLDDPRWISEESHAGGTAFDFEIKNGTPQDYLNIHRELLNSEIWPNIMDIEHTKDYIHVDQDYTYDACDYSRYPLLKQNDTNTYVLVLQRALSSLGYLTPSQINGIYDYATINAVKQFQFNAGLTNDGIMGCNSWLALTYHLTH